MKTQDKAAKLLLPLAIIALVAVAWGITSARRTQEIQQHMATALRAAGQGQAATAESEWRAASRLDPRNSQIYEIMGQYEINTGRWPQAVETFRSLERIAPATPHLYCRLAAALLRNGDQKAAFETANQELKRDPNCVAALGLITSVMVLQPKSDAKLRRDYMRRLVQLQPDDVDFLHMYAEELANGYLYDDLRPVIAHILKLNPQDAESYNLLGYADLASPVQPSGVNQAVADFQKSLAINPANGGAHFGLGRAALRQWKGFEAVKHLEIARQMRPDAPRINFELSNAYRMAGQTKLADEAKNRFLTWERVVEEHRQLQVRCMANPQDPQYPKKLGLLLVQSNGDPGEASYYLKKALELTPGDAEVKAALDKLPSVNAAAPAASEKVAVANGATPFR